MSLYLIFLDHLRIVTNGPSKELKEKLRILQKLAMEFVLYEFSRFKRQCVGKCVFKTSRLWSWSAGMGTFKIFKRASIDVSRYVRYALFVVMYSEHCVAARDLRGQIISCIVRILATVRTTSDTHFDTSEVFYLRISCSVHKASNNANIKFGNKTGRRDMFDQCRVTLHKIYTFDAHFFFAINHSRSRSYKDNLLPLLVGTTSGFLSSAS